MSVAAKEALKIPPQAMEQIVIGANQDIRQVLLFISSDEQMNCITMSIQASFSTQVQFLDYQLQSYSSLFVV